MNECKHDGRCNLPPYPTCLCGARADTPNTHPHVIGCPCEKIRVGDIVRVREYTHAEFGPGDRIARVTRIYTKSVRVEAIAGRLDSGPLIELSRIRRYEGALPEPQHAAAQKIVADFYEVRDETNPGAAFYVNGNSYSADEAARVAQLHLLTTPGAKVKVTHTIKYEVVAADGAPTTSLTNAEMDRIRDLGRAIMIGLSCDANDKGVPCRTDRLIAVKRMAEYLRIHGSLVVETT